MELVRYPYSIISNYGIYLIPRLFQSPDLVLRRFCQSVDVCCIPDVLSVRGSTDTELFDILSHSGDILPYASFQSRSIRKSTLSFLAMMWNIWYFFDILDHLLIDGVEPRVCRKMVGRR